MQFNSPQKRSLSVLSLVMINVIAIDSLRNLPTNAATGNLLPYYYLIAAVVFLLPCALITAELATLYPKAGGVYVWVTKAFGAQWGFVTMWLQWIYNVFWYPTILAFMAVNVAYLVNPTLATNKIFVLSIIVGLFTIATYLNAFNMQVSSFISIVCAILGTLVPMLIIIALGASWLWQHKPLAIHLGWHNLLPAHFWQPHHSSFLVVIFFSLMGLEMSAVHAEEVKNPQRDYPRALLISSIIIVLSLVLASSAIAIVIPPQQLNIIAGLDQALSAFLQAFHLDQLMPIVIILILLGGFGGMAAWVVGPTKGMMVAAQDGCLPRWLAKHNRYNAPQGMLLLQFIMVLLLSGLFLYFPTISGVYWLLSDLTAQIALLFYILFFAAAIRLRYVSEAQSGFRIPGGKFGIWLTGSIGIVACLFGMSVGFTPPEALEIGTPGTFRAMLILGIVIFVTLPVVIYQLTRWNQE